MTSDERATRSETRWWFRAMCAASWLALAGCGSAKSLLTDERLVELLEQARGELRSSSLSAGLKDAYENACIKHWLDEDYVKAWDYSTRHPEETGRVAPNIEGTWKSVVPGGCKKVAQEGQVPLDTDCTQTITFSDQGGGHVTQQYDLNGVSGQGEVAWIAGSGRGLDSTRTAAVMQTNHASGNGCQQEIINLILFLPEGTWDQRLYPQVREVWNFNAILSSTCPAPKRQCGRMGLYQ